MLENLKVSSHFLITRSGNLIQFVPIHKRSWHAGKSSFQGRTNCNDFSIGIELEGSVGVIFEEAQYKSLKNLTSALFLKYERLSLESVVGHNEIASDRKEDPGEHFDWPKFFELEK